MLVTLAKRLTDRGVADAIITAVSCDVEVLKRLILGGVAAGLLCLNDVRRFSG